MLLAVAAVAAAAALAARLRQLGGVTGLLVPLARKFLMRRRAGGTVHWEVRIRQDTP